MKFSGPRDLEIELLSDASSVQLTMRYQTAYEAAIAYDEMANAARAGKLKMNVSLGEVLEEEGPHLR
jgi:hypothetical protein